MDKKVRIIGFLLLLISCTDVKVKRDEENIDKKTIVFLDHTGDTIIKCQYNDTPIFEEVERMVNKDSKTYYVKLDSLEYLELCVYNDIKSSVIWQIRKRK